MLDKNAFKAAIVGHGDRQEDLAQALGMSPATLSAKINGTQDFRRHEIERIATRYNLTIQEAGRIFFTDIVA